MTEALIQGTQEWLRARAGRATASRIADIMAKIKSGAPGASRANYMAEIVAERLTGTPADQYVSKEMARGTEMEPVACAAYEFYWDVETVEVGFVAHPFIDMAGASPDRLVGDKGLVEFKCPNTSTHINTLLSQSIGGNYIQQMQFQMACTERDWCDFVSFDPRMPEALKLFIKRVDRDEVMIGAIEEEVQLFLAEVDLKVSQLTALIAGTTPLTTALEQSVAQIGGASVLQ